MNLNCITSSRVKIFLCRSENYNKCKCVDYEKPIAKDKLSVFQNLFRIYSKLLYGYDTSFVSLLRALQALLFFPFSRLSDNRKDRKTRESEEWSQKERRQSKRFAVTRKRVEKCSRDKTNYFDSSEFRSLLKNYF